MLNIFSQFNVQNLLDRDPGKFEPHPRRDWAIIFFMGIITLVLILLAHFYLYVYMRTDNSFKSDNNPVRPTEVKLNRKGLAEITAMFEGKKAEFQNFLVSPPHITDPSLADSSVEIITPSPKKVNLKNASGTPESAQ